MSVSCPFIIQKAGSITLHEESLWLCSDRSTVRGNAVRGAHDCRNQQNVSKEWRADMGQKCWRTILFLLSPPHTYSRLHSWHSCWDVSHQSAALLHFILKIKHTAVFVILFRKPASGTTPVYSFTLVLQLFHTLTNKQQCDSADSEQRQHLAVFHRFDTLKVDSRQFN